jgi:hypothetical protein
MAQSEAAAMLTLDVQKNLSGPRADEVIAFYNYSVARLVNRRSHRGRNRGRRKFK